MNDLRIEMRTRNNVLWHVIFDSSDSVASFCATHKLCQAAVGTYLNLKVSPYLKTGEPSLLAKQLCSIAALSPRELFPPDLYSGVIPRVMVAEVEARHVSLRAAQSVALPPAQEDELMGQELQEALKLAMGGLTLRQAKMLRMRFGMDDEREHTFSEIAASFACSTQRVRDVINEGMRKLRRPMTSRPLRPFIGAGA